MAVMRSVVYVPSNNDKMVDEKAAGIAADILTLDLEDSVPPAEKEKGRKKIREYLSSPLM